MEEIERSVSPLVEVVSNLLKGWLDSLLSALSFPQVAVIVISFLLALLVHRWVRSLIVRLETSVATPIWQRLFRTARSISLPIAWVTGLWISLLILGSFGQVTGMVRLVASLLNAWVAIRIVSTLIPNHTSANVFAWVAWAVAALNAIGQLDTFIRWLDDQRFTSTTLTVSVWDIVQGLIVTGVLIWLAFFASGQVQSRLERSASLNPSMRVLASKILRIVLIAVALIVGMRSVGVDLTAFAVFSGALGIGIGLGLQRTVANLVAGFTMLADRSIKPGDVIEITTGSGPTYGEVRTLGARYVSVKTRSGTETLIPNELLISNPVTNWSFSDRLVRRDVPVGVSYNADIELAQVLCIEAAGKCPRVLKKPAPICLIKGFGDSSVDMELRFWMGDPEEGVANIASEVYLHIWKLFQANKIEIPFPQRDLNIKNFVTAENGAPMAEVFSAQPANKAE